MSGPETPSSSEGARRIVVCSYDGQEQYSWSLTCTRNGGWHVTIEADDGRVWDASGVSLVAALRDLRLDLESLQLRLCINAARPDAHVSGMIGDMYGEEIVYLLASMSGGRPIAAPILGFAPCSVVGTVEEQVRFFDRYAQPGFRGRLRRWWLVFRSRAVPVRLPGGSLVLISLSSLVSVPKSVADEAKRQRGGWVFELESDAVDSESVPIEQIRRGFGVDGRGRLSGEVWINPEHKGS